MSIMKGGANQDLLVSLTPTSCLSVKSMFSRTQDDTTGAERLLDNE